VLDLEMPPDWSGISVVERIKRVSDWLVAVELQLGVTPIIYMSPSFASELGPAEFLKKYQLWVVHYTLAQAPTVPAPFITWLFWQYSETDAVAGVQGHCDVNRFNGTADDLQKLQKKAVTQTLVKRMTSSIQALFNRLFK
jgi:GH25 family lysozyme M1 (1,4-beta-N-acetylmuramidase)